MRLNMTQAISLVRSIVGEANQTSLTPKDIRLYRAIPTGGLEAFTTPRTASIFCLATYQEQ